MVRRLQIILLSPVGRRIALLILALLGANLAAWLWALVAFRDFPLLMGTALLAYSFDLPLEDPSLVWLRWMKSGYAPWTPPEIGDSTVFPASTVFDATALAEHRDGR